MAGPPSPKRQRTGEKSDSAPDDEKIRAVLEAVGQVEEEIEAEQEKMAREILVIESKYNAVKRPFFEKRAKLLRDIPGFWKQALISHPFIAELFGEDEAKLLDSLNDLDVTFLDQNGGFKIELTFGENPYFGKTTLWKQITYSDDGEPNVTASEIKWKSSSEAKAASKESQFFEWLVSTEGDQDVADLIKDDVWKNPVQFYMEDDEDDEDDGDDEAGEGDDDEEDDE